jgi:hypothetical protein
MSVGFTLVGVLVAGAKSAVEHSITAFGSARYRYCEGRSRSRFGGSLYVGSRVK